MTVVKSNIQDLHVEVIPAQRKFAAAQNVNIILSYRNLGSETMRIYKWNFPEIDLIEPIFKVTRDDEPVAYVGPIFKRRAPTDEDTINLTPGSIISTTIDLSSVYDMTKTGNYMIQFSRNAEQLLMTVENTHSRSIPALIELQETILISAPVAVFVVGRRNRLIEEANEARSQIRAMVPTYAGCSASQTSSIRSALTAAENYANEAFQYLSGAASAKARFTTWFGAFSAINWNKLKSHFSNLTSTVASRTLSFDCSCPNGQPNTYAYVYPSMHYKIYLCSQFWKSATTGTDSMGGTIIHELAHFTVIAGTNDHAYGQSSCQSLAQRNPIQALANSDNLQYFSENNPRLN